MIRTLAIVVLLAACGGKQSSTPKHEEHGEEHMPPELAKFHDVLAPLWHAAPGPDRMKNACAGAGAMETDAASVPNGKTLVDAVAAMKTACADPTTADASFAKVHEAFHGLLEAGEQKKPAEPEPTGY